MIPSGLIKQFIKDYRFPVKVVKSEYFNYYLDYIVQNYDFSFAVAAKNLREMRSSLTSDEEFMKRCRIAYQDAIEYVKTLPGWEEFNTSKIDGAHNEYKIRTSGLYAEERVGSTYISIDLEKANFNILKGKEPHCVGAIPLQHSYEDFIRKFTDYDYIVESKQIRQIIFGNLNPKRQRTLQTRVILGLAEHLVSNGMPSDDLVFYSPDELVVRTDGSSSFRTAIYGVVEGYMEGLPFRIEEFGLRYLGGNCYTKEYGGGNFKLRQVPSTMFMQALKHRIGEEVCEMDLVFEYEKRLARFIEPFVWG